MSNARVFAGLSLLVLSSSCSMFGSLSAKTGSPAPSTSAPSSSATSRKGTPPHVDGPTVKAESSDSPDIERAVKRLDELEQMIGANNFAEYARESHRFHSGLLFQNLLRGENKRDAIQARLEAIDAAAFAAFGGRLAKLGDGKRVLKLDSDAVEAVEATVDACEKASKLRTTGTGEAAAELAKAVALYEKAMARAIKLDANALHYYGDRSRSGAGDVDTPAALMTCEVALSSVTTQFEEEYAPEVRPEVPDETGCGVIEWMASGVALGGGKFAPYTRTVAGNSFLKSVPCKSIPARNNYPKALADAANQFAEHVQMPAKAIINVVNGKPRVEVDDQDLHTYRYQDLRAYSKQFKFPANPCGDKTFCEAGGSQAMAAFNRLEFSLERAAARAGNKPDVCRNQLKEVKAKAAWFETFHAEAVASHEWIAGATYKTKKGVKLSEKQLIAAFADNGKLAEDRLDEKYCNKPAKSPK